MRPAVLDHGYGVGHKLLFRLIRLLSGHPVPDAAKLTFYRSDFYGTHAKQVTQEAMRGRSAWSVGDRELMAAYVSKVNESPFCIGAHTATASGGQCRCAAHRPSALRPDRRGTAGNAGDARQADPRGNAVRR